MDIFTTLAVAVAIGFGIRIALETWELITSSRDLRSEPVAGPESAVGRSAVVISDFTQASSGQLLGRVRFDGEDWRAEYVGSTSPPYVGQEVEISDIDAAKLTVKVV